eukprot:6462218-Amphidinium_carterae.2
MQALVSEYKRYCSYLAEHLCHGDFCSFIFLFGGRWGRWWRWYNPWFQYSLHSQAGRGREFGGAGATVGKAGITVLAVRWEGSAKSGRFDVAFRPRVVLSAGACEQTTPIACYDPPKNIIQPPNILVGVKQRG